MLNYTKRVLLLKPISNFSARCLIRLECAENSTLYQGELLTPYGEFTTFETLNLIIALNGKIFTAPLNNSAGFSGEFLNVLATESASAVIVKNGEPICFGESGEGAPSLNELLSFTTTPTYEEYDDEIIASENYFEEFYEQERIFTKTTSGDGELKTQEGTPQTDCNSLLYENEPSSCEEGRYFLSVREKIEELLSAYPKNCELERLVPGGRFCKIRYDDEKFYSVGTITENGCVAYLCYAVEGDFSCLNLDLKQYFRFIPSSPFAPYGRGYYLVFQAAETGETLTFNN